MWPRRLFWQQQLAASASAWLVVAPAGFLLSTPAEVATGPALLARAVLAGFVGRWSGVSGTALGRRRAPRWLARC